MCVCVCVSTCACVYVLVYLETLYFCSNFLHCYMLLEVEFYKYFQTIWLPVEKH